VVLSGAGTEAFCAGADIAELVNNPAPSARRAFFASIASLIEKINLCPVPVVARVHGFALAGGCGLAAACDITLASDDAVFGLPEVGIGLAAMVVMAPLSRVVQKKALTQMIMTGERISAARALEIGLVTAVHAKASLDSEADALCKRLIKQGPHALQASKQALLDVTEREYLPFLHELADRSALLSLGSEATEGLTAFTQKREPSWRKA
jgi:enoyl-CoA hydratase/carnithine racemase